jgi:hypothetical protein
VTGPAVAFLVLIDTATVAGTPSSFIPPGVDVLATETLFRLPARGFRGQRTLTEHVENTSVFVSGPCAFVINPKQATAFARRAKIPLNSLPAVAVLDQASDELAIISHGNWSDMLGDLYDAVARFYHENAQHAFLMLTQKIDDIDQELADLDRARADISRGLKQSWPASATLTLDWLYHTSWDLEQFVSRWRELIPSDDPNLDSSDLTHPLREYWSLRRLSTEQRRIYKILRIARRQGGDFAHALVDKVAVAKTMAQVRDTVMREHQYDAFEATLDGWLSFCRNTAPLLKEKYRLIARSYDGILASHDWAPLINAAVEREAPGSLARRSHLVVARRNVEAKLAVTTPPSLVHEVERVTKKQKRHLCFSRAKLRPGEAAELTTETLKTITALST